MCRSHSERYRGLSEDRRGNVLLDTWVSGLKRKESEANKPPCVQLANMVGSIHSEVRDVFLKLAAKKTTLLMTRLFSVIVSQWSRQLSTCKLNSY